MVVYRKQLDDIEGVLYIKHLVGIKVNGKTVGDLCDKKVIYVHENRNLRDVLNAFLTSHHHLFVVMNEFGGVVGIVTLEDILEEILGAEIMDEDDKHQDLRKLARQRLSNSHREKSDIV